MSRVAERVGGLFGFDFVLGLKHKTHMLCLSPFIPVSFLSLTIILFSLPLYSSSVIYSFLFY